MACRLDKICDYVKEEIASIENRKIRDEEKKNNNNKRKKMARTTTCDEIITKNERERQREKK